MELKGKTAIITGSSGKLGSEIALALARAGCDCVCHYNQNKAAATDLVDEIILIGQKAIAVKANLTSNQQLNKMFRQIADVAKPEILINSASIFYRKPLKDITFEDTRNMLDTNLTSAIMVSKKFVELTETGKIINISDIAAIRPWADYILYCTSKAGLNGATKAMAKELAPDFCVNAIALGIAELGEDFSEDQKNRQLSFIPAGRLPKPNEITQAIIFLLQNDYITGQILNIDGGRCI